MREELFHILGATHGGTAAGWGPDRCNQGPGIQVSRRELLGQDLQVVVGGIDVGVRQAQEQVHSVELHAVHVRGGGQVQHGVEIDGRLGIRSFADQAGPHGGVQCGEFVGAHNVSRTRR